MPSKQLRMLSRNPYPQGPFPEDRESVSSEGTVDSVDTEPSYSKALVPSIPKFCLKQSFPSIFKTSNAMNSARRRLDKHTFYNLAPVFVGTFETVIRSLDDLPYDVQSDSDYEVAKYKVALFGRHAKHLLQYYPSDIKLKRELRDAMKTVVKAMRMLMEFLETTQRIFASHKPLPLLPSGAKAGKVNRARPYVPLSVIIEEEMTLIPGASTHVGLSGYLPQNSPPPSPSGTPPWVHHRSTQQISPNQSHKGSLIKRILRRKAALVSEPLPTTPTTSDSTFVEAGNNESFSSFPNSSGVSLTRPEQPYHPRQSLFYFILPDINVDMPLPQGDTVALRLDSMGRVKGSSLAALVRLLTSKKGVSEKDFLTTFFICFRFYATSRDLLHELKNRFFEKPSVPLNDDQLQVWISYTIAVRIRVGRVIQMWLDLYWRPEDDEVLDDLQTFALESLTKELPEKLMESILEGLDAACTIHGGAIRAQDLLFAYQRSNPAGLPPTNVTLGDLSRSSATGCLILDSAAMREELARQVTIWSNEKFQQMDVEELISHWEKDDNGDLDILLKQISQFERKLCIFVVDSILTGESPKERARLVEHWVDIAARCLRLRNFSGAHTIFCGLGHSAIHRLKESILASILFALFLLVEHTTKSQYRTLEQMFDPRTNYHDYRKALGGIEPMVPLCSVHFRDITTALKVMPRYIGLNDGDSRKNLINIRSYGILMKTIRGIECSILPYDILKDDMFLESLEDRFETLPDEDDPKNELHNLSMLKEPRNPEFTFGVDDPWRYTFTGKPNASGSREYLSIPLRDRAECLENSFTLPAIFEKAF